MGKGFQVQPIILFSIGDRRIKQPISPQSNETTVGEFICLKYLFQAFSKRIVDDREIKPIFLPGIFVCIYRD